MQGILVGLVFIAAGGAIIYRHRELYQMFGEFEWAQKAFGDSLIVYPLTGVAIIVIGILLMFGIGFNPTEVDSQFGE